MTVNEARNILLQKMRDFTSKECPLVWVGDLLEEDGTEFVFEASPYAQGEKPEDEAAPFAVNKRTGEVDIRIPLY